MIELAQLILKKITSSSNIVYKDLPKDDPTQRKANVDKLNSKTSWLPFRTLDEGLDKTIPYFANELKRVDFKF